MDSIINCTKSIVLVQSKKLDCFVSLLERERDISPTEHFPKGTFLQRSGWVTGTALGYTRDGVSLLGMD